MNFRRIFGWGLVLAGLIIIIAVLYFSYEIFMGKTQIPEIFKYKKASAALTMPLSQDEIQTGINEAIQEQIKNIVPPEFITKIFNLISWSIFAALLIFAGSKISLIGVKMSRKEL